MEVPYIIHYAPLEFSTVRWPKGFWLMILNYIQKHLKIHLTKKWFCTSVLNQLSQGLHPYFSISCSSSIERTESTHSCSDACTILLQIWSGWECQDYIFIFIWGLWITYVFTCNGRMRKETRSRNPRLLGP